MRETNPFWIVNETRVGHFDEEHGFDYGQPIAPIERSKRLHLASGFRIWGWPPTEELIEKIVKEVGFVQVDFWIGTSLHNHWIKVSGKTEEDFYDYYVRMLKAAAEKYGDRFFWTITGEPDSQAPNWPVERFGSKKEAYDFFMEWLKGFAPATDTKTKLRWHSYLTQKGVDLKKHHVGIHLGFPMPAHYSYELGVRMVWVECNAYLPTGVQPTVAFARGAANQFRESKTYWGLDFSTWNDLSGLATSYDEKGRRLGGCTPSLLLREWMYTFLSGANLLHQEISERTHWIWSPKPYARLSKTGKLAARFGKFAQSFDRGKPLRTVAVMLEHDHGWLSSLDDAGANQVWFGTVPAGKADLTINHFFDLAFPGHRGYFSGYAELFCQKPWKKMGDFREVVKSGKDMGPYEKGRLAASRWGDVIDVVLENCPEDVLADYKVLVLLGGLKVNGKLAKKLENYVRNGGSLIANVTNFFDCPEELLENAVTHGTQGRPYTIPSKRQGRVSPAVENFLGFKFTGIKSRASCSYWTKGNKAMFEDGFLVEKVELADALPIATIPRYLYLSRREQKVEYDPLVVERKLGKGKAITTLAYFMMQPVFRTPLKITEHVYDDAIYDTLPFRVEGPPVQYLFNRIEKGWLVSIFNNGDKNWRGGIVSLRKPSSTNFEWGRGDSERWKNADDKWTLAVNVPRFAFKIIRFQD